MKEGCLYFITGIHGCGKTSIGKALLKMMQNEKKIVAMLDGDALRQALGDVYGYDAASRRALAMNYVRIAKILCEQQINVILCTISMFDSVRDWNRAHFESYYEIYITSDIETLKKRDPKKLYSKAASNEIFNVLGINMNYEKPKNPNLTLNNNGKNTPEELAEIIYKCFAERG